MDSRDGGWVSEEGGVDGGADVTVGGEVGRERGGDGGFGGVFLVGL